MARTQHVVWTQVVPVNCPVCAWRSTCKHTNTLANSAVQPARPLPSSHPNKCPRRCLAVFMFWIWRRTLDLNHHLLLCSVNLPHPPISTPLLQAAPGFETSIGVQMKRISRLEKPYKSACLKDYPQHLRPFAVIRDCSEYGVPDQSWPFCAKKTIRIHSFTAPFGAYSSILCAVRHTPDMQIRSFIRELYYHIPMALGISKASLGLGHLWLNFGVCASSRLSRLQHLPLL
jgi:hypothetical protein